MLFTGLLEQTVEVKRLTVTSGTKRAYTTVGTYPCLLQPMGAEQTVLHGLAMGRAFKCFVDISADILPSDSATINGKTYKVSGIKPYNFGVHQHYELVLDLEDE